VAGPSRRARSGQTGSSGASIIDFEDDGSYLSEDILILYICLPDKANPTVREGLKRRLFWEMAKLLKDEPNYEVSISKRVQSYAYKGDV
jgi:hypothetical protein